MSHSSYIEELIKGGFVVEAIVFPDGIIIDPPRRINPAVESKPSRDASPRADERKNRMKVNNFGPIGRQVNIGVKLEDVVTYDVERVDPDSEDTDTRELTKD
ncbi:hypothetical protein [Nonomuraea sp. NPDC023979]|uniref:hypothetical protein n=1 Tax=Nonomuraea sp. NPDC023979 TaxID=3154796 RepID=UPI0033D52085